MSRYIDAEPLEKIAEVMLKDATENAWDGGHKAGTWGEIVRLLRESKTADVAEVIRCKDCKHLYTDPMQRFCRLTDNHCEEDDYCNFAERKG